MFKEKEAVSGFHYFVMGWHLITQPGLRRFVIMPILLNIVLLIGLFWLFITQISNMIDSVMYFVPDWLSWLSSILFIFCRRNDFVGFLFCVHHLVRLHRRAV